MESTPEKSKPLIAFSSAPSEEIAKQLSHDLVERKLAACVSIVPKMTSVYHWQGSVQQDSEGLLLIKTTKSHINAIEQYFTKNHPYDTPELIACNISGGSDSYLAWLTQTLT